MTYGGGGDGDGGGGGSGEGGGDEDHCNRRGPISSVSSSPLGIGGGSLTGGTSVGGAEW